MKSVANPARKRKAFTIVELLTVMSIIVILIGLLIPALNKVKRFATDVKQRAQLHSIKTALELFSNEFEGYPDSGALDSTGAQYCGAMKLCEAIMGQDLLGVHSNTVFRADGMDSQGTDLYPNNIDQMALTLRDNNLKARRGPYLQADNANAYRMGELYSDAGGFLADSFVLCDVYGRQTASGERTGMPILYYKANTAYNFHDPNRTSAMTPTDNNGNIYNHFDNETLLALGKPWEAAGGATTGHKLSAAGTDGPERFYKNTRSDKIVTASRPNRADSFILISAGYDGEYGTTDDICNFDWKYREY